MCLVARNFYWPTGPGYSIEGQAQMRGGLGDDQGTGGGGLIECHSIGEYGRL
jgi:hypothetical protein